MFRFESYRTKVMKLPLLFPVKHASKLRSHNDVVRLRLYFSNQTSFVETDILPRSYVTGESIGSILNFVKVFFEGVFSKLEFEIDSNPQNILLSQWHNEIVQSNLTAFSAFDLLAYKATKTLSSQYFRRSVKRQDSQSFWGECRLIPLLPSPIVRAYLKLNQNMKTNLSFKIKMPKFEDIKIDFIKALLDFEKQISILDFNGQWTLEDAFSLVKTYPKLGSKVWEQVFAKDQDPEVFFEFQSKTGVSLMLDESLCSQSDINRFAKKGQDPAFIWNLRIAKNGGLSAVLNIAEIAEAKGIKTHLGCFVGEGELLRKAHHLARRSIQFAGFDRNPCWLSPFGK